MGYYFWKGVDAKGLPLEGTLEANNASEGKKSLNYKKILQVEIEHVPSFLLKRQLEDRVVMELLTQLHRLLNSGVDLNDSLTFMLRNQSDLRMSYLLCTVRQDIQEGRSLSKAFQRHSAIPIIFVHLLEVAESSGRLLNVLQVLLQFFSFQDKIHREQKKLLNYPLVIFSIGSLLFLGLLLFVVPMFKRMYGAMGDDLFWVTKGLLALSDSMRFNSLYWILGASGTVIFLMLLNRRIGWKWLLYLFPGGSKIIHATRMLFYSRSIEIMLNSGVHLHNTLTLLDSLFPPSLRPRAEQVHQELSAGKTLQEAYSHSNLLPAFMVRLIALGESSGHLASAYDRIAVHYQEQLEKIMEKLNSRVEPVCMVLISGLVLLVLLAIYLPMFRMADTL